MPPCWIHVSSGWRLRWASFLRDREKLVTKQLSFPASDRCARRHWSQVCLPSDVLWFPQRWKFGFVFTYSHENHILQLLQDELSLRVVLACHGSTRKTSERCREVPRLFWVMLVSSCVERRDVSLYETKSYFWCCLNFVWSRLSSLLSLRVNDF